MSSIIQNKFHQILGDGARLTKFTFHIPPLNGSKELTDIIAYSVKGVRAPKMKHSPINLMHKGRPIPIRGTTEFDQQFEVTFYLQETHVVKRFFELWMMMIEQRHYYYNPRKQEQKQYQLSFQETYNIKALPDYLTFYNPKAFLSQRNFDGDEVTAVYEIFNVFPIDVSAITYDYSSVGTLGEFTVTFAYSHYVLWSANPHGYVYGDIFSLDGSPNTGYPKTTDLTKQLWDSLQQLDDEYTYNVERFNLFNSFNQGQGSAKEGLEMIDPYSGRFWRPNELARWDLIPNRWEEASGGNTQDDALPLAFNFDVVEEEDGDLTGTQVGTTGNYANQSESACETWISSVSGINPVASVISTLNSVGATLNGLGQLVDSVGNVIAKVDGVLNGKWVDNAGKFIGNIGDTINGTVNSLGQVVDSAGNVIGNVGQSVSGTLNGLGQVVDSAGNVISQFDGSILDGKWVDQAGNFIGKKNVFYLLTNYTGYITDINKKYILMKKMTKSIQPQYLQIVSVNIKKEGQKLNNYFCENNLNDENELSIGNELITLNKDEKLRENNVYNIFSGGKNYILSNVHNFICLIYSGNKYEEEKY